MTYLHWSRIGADECARNARDVQNQAMANYQTFLSQPINCTTPVDMQWDHPNLRAKLGYGITDSCAIDADSKIRNSKEQLTHTRCRQQLFGRVFQAVPNLRPGVPEPEKELPIIQGGTSTRSRQITEVDYNRFVPLVGCLKDTVQNPRYIVEPWVRGGEHTREYIHQDDYMQRCQRDQKIFR